MQPNLLDVALMERGVCDAMGIPTGRFPPYSQSLRGTFDANGEATVDFEPERDMLLTTLSVESTGGSLAVRVNMTYCNTKMLIHSAARAWARCCDRKPVFLVGMRDNKKMHFKLTGGTPDDDWIISVHGFQGRDCAC